jgi:hypothetical protein
VPLRWNHDVDDDGTTKRSVIKTLERSVPQASPGNRPRSGGRQGPRGPIEPEEPAIQGETGGAGGGHPPAEPDRRRIERRRRHALLGRADGRRGGQEGGLARRRVQAGVIREGRSRWIGPRCIPRPFRLLRGTAAARSSPALGAAIAIPGMRSRVERIDARRPSLAHQDAGEHQPEHRPGSAEWAARRVGDQRSHGDVAALVSGRVEGFIINADRTTVKGRPTGGFNRRGSSFRNPTDPDLPDSPRLGLDRREREPGVDRRSTERIAPIRRILCLGLLVPACTREDGCLPQVVPDAPSLLGRMFQVEGRDSIMVRRHPPVDLLSRGTTSDVDLAIGGPPTPGVAPQDDGRNRHRDHQATHSEPGEPHGRSSSALDEKAPILGLLPSRGHHQIRPASSRSPQNDKSEGIDWTKRRISTLY